MENNEKMIAAIDIGTTKIAAVAAKRENGRYEVIGFGSSPSNGIKRGVVYNIDDTVKSIDTVCDSSILDLDEVFVGIAGQYVSTYTNSCRVEVNGIVEESHLIELMRIAKNNFVKPGNETLDAILLSYYVDDQEVDDPIGMEAESLYGNFHVIMGQSAMVNNIKKCVKLAGLKVRSLFLEPLASSEAVLFEEEKEHGAVLVDIGGGTTDIAIYKNGKVVHTAVIPIGGNVVTNDIKEHFKITTEQAEEIKKEYGSAASTSGVDVNIEIPTSHQKDSVYVSRNELSQVIQARMEEILESVKFQIEMIYTTKVPKGVVITGGGSLLANLKQLASFIFKNEVRIACPIMNMSGTYAENLNKPQFSTLVGLIIKGYDFEDGQEREDLIKQEKEQPEPIPEPEPIPVINADPIPEQQSLFVEPKSDLEDKSDKKNKAKDGKQAEKRGVKGFFSSLLSKIEEE